MLSYEIVSTGWGHHRLLHKSLKKEVNVTMNHPRVIMLIVLSLLMALTTSVAADVNSDNPSVVPTPAPKGSGITNALAEITSRFQAFDKNYMMWQWTNGDEPAMEAQFSLKYKVFKTPAPFTSKADGEFSAYFSYTGKIDFYMGTRSSDPVINRVSNPALHLRLESAQADDSDKKWYQHLQWVDLSLEHKSNGQVVDPWAKETAVNTNYGKYLTQIEYTKGNYEYFDRISRGSNYVSLWLGVEVWKDFLVELIPKIFLNQEADITWGPYAKTGTNFSYFDLLRTKVTYTWFKERKGIPEITAGVEYLLGKKGFATDSLDAYLIIPLRLEWGTNTTGLNLPLMVKAHTGPMDRLSDYSKSMNSVGVGFAFTYY